MSAIAVNVSVSSPSASHHLLPFRPFPGVHRAQKPTGNCLAGKLPVRTRTLFRHAARMDQCTTAYLPSLARTM
jgi:hypothetical protein